MRCSHARTTRVHALDSRFTQNADADSGVPAPRHDDGTRVLGNRRTVVTRPSRIGPSRPPITRSARCGPCDCGDSTRSHRSPTCVFDSDENSTSSSRGERYWTCAGPHEEDPAPLVSVDRIYGRELTVLRSSWTCAALEVVPAVSVGSV